MYEEHVLEHSDWSDTDSEHEHAHVHHHSEDYHADRHHHLTHPEGRHYHESRKGYSAEETAWHEDHQTAHVMHEHHKPHHYYHEDHSDSDSDDEYIENPYEYEVQWQAHHHHHDDELLDHIFKDHEDHWEEHFKSGQMKSD